MKSWRAGLLVVASLVAACHRGAGGTGAAGSGGAGGGGDAPTADELRAADTVATAAGLADAVLDFSDALFAFDPDIDPKGSAAKNASKIQSNAGSASCATVTATSTTSFTVDFGGGCTIGKITASGQLGVAVSLAGASGQRSVIVELTFTKMVIDDFDVDGTAKFTTSTGFKFEVNLDVTHQGAHDTADLTVAGAKGAFSVDGSFGTMTGTASTTVAFSGVKVAKGDCWPEAGSAAVSSGATDVTISFSADTATSGLATLSFAVGQHTTNSCYALPSHGSCQAGACPST